MSDSSHSQHLRIRARRRVRRRTIDHSVASPCVQVCRFSAGALFCDGCYRTLDEVREWLIMTREEKLAVLECLAVRRQEGGLPQ